MDTRFSAIGETIKKALNEKRVRTGPLKTAYYTLHNGYWIIADDISDEEKQDALTWLACAELGVPKELRDRLIEEIRSDLRSQKGSGRTP